MITCLFIHVEIFLVLEGNYCSKSIEYFIIFMYDRLIVSFYLKHELKVMQLILSVVLFLELNQLLSRHLRLNTTPISIACFIDGVSYGEERKITERVTERN